MKTILVVDVPEGFTSAEVALRVEVHTMCNQVKVIDPAELREKVRDLIFDYGATRSSGFVADAIMRLLGVEK